jgi:hypothetical protein
MSVKTSYVRVMSIGQAMRAGCVGVCREKGNGMYAVVDTATEESKVYFATSY